MAKWNTTKDRVLRKMNTYIYYKIINHGTIIVGYENVSICLKYSDGHKEWWANNLRHRTNGPAVEYINGSKKWYLDDKLHRTDGPAIEYVSGYKEWRICGKLYRKDGPSIELPLVAISIDERR